MFCSNFNCPQCRTFCTHLTILPVSLFNEKYITTIHIKDQTGRLKLADLQVKENENTIIELQTKKTQLLEAKNRTVAVGTAPKIKNHVVQNLMKMCNLEAEQHILNYSHKELLYKSVLVHR